MKKGLKAFTLSELLVVLIIVGILVLIALPNLLPLVNKARSVEAQQGLKVIYSLEKAYYMQHLRYSDSLDEIGFEMEELEDNSNNYTFTVENAGENGFTAKATAKKDFDKDGKLNVWVINERKKLEELVKD